MSDVDVIIVNYRSAVHTAACVASVHEVARLDGIAACVIVVNNADDAGTLENLVAPSGAATFIHNAANLGFGAACNIGARHGEAQLTLFLNPDARLRTGYFRTCISFMRDAANESIGIVGPAILDGEDRPARTSSALPSRASLIARIFGAQNAFLPESAHAASGPVGQVIGAALMIRRSLFEHLGGFDERYFLYYEDVDLCARAAAAQSSCYYLKTAEAVHIGRVSSSQDKGLTLALFLRSMLTYAGLHFGGLTKLLLILLTFAVEFPLRVLRGAITSASITGVAAMRAYRLLLVNLVTGTAIVRLAARGKA